MNINIDEVMQYLAEEGIKDKRQPGEMYECARPCKECGSKTRYVSSRGCVDCRKRARSNPLYDEAVINLEKARATGAPRYDGRPCKVCNTRERYTVNSGCVKCTADKRDAFNAKKASRYHSDTSLIMWVNEKPAKGCEHYYKQIPAMAARQDGGQWSVRYTGARHLMTGSERLLTGRDVMERPNLAQWLFNEMVMQTARPGGHHDIIPVIAAPLKAAYLDWCRVKSVKRVTNS